MHLLGLSSEAERKPVKKRASSATLEALSTATELGGDRDMRRNVPKGRLACPTAESARKKPRPQENSKPE